MHKHKQTHPQLISIYNILTRWSGFLPMSLLFIIMAIVFHFIVYIL